jgi:pimeloyl-ACP methyl ester carboxylesterase
VGHGNSLGLKKWIAISLSGALLALVAVYFAVPQIQPCALLSRVLPLSLLPPNPNVTGLAFTPLFGARAVIGERACSGYRMEIPDQWNGDLVVYAHGFRGATPALTVTNLPLREDAIRRGFAWAASSYRANGFNPHDGIDDTLLLIDEFKKKIGPPKHVFLYGSSMGGFVVIDALERHSDIYSGGVSECGMLAGAGQLDYILSVNVLADYLAGADMYDREHKGWKAQRALLDREIYPKLGAPPDYVFDENALSGQVLPPPQIRLTTRGEAFRNAEILLSGGHRPFAYEGFAAAYKLIFEPTRAPYAFGQSVVNAGTNVLTKYDVDQGFAVTAAELNSGVRRISADSRERALFTFTGKLWVPLLTIHDSGDLFVPILNAREYARLAASAGMGHLLVQRAIRRFLHCDFTQSERDRAFNDLVEWVRSGSKPEGEDLSSSLADVGRQWTDPLRPDDPGRN